MHDFLFSPIPFALALLAGIIFWTIRDQSNRKIRERVIHEIDNSKIRAVYFDTKSTLKAFAPLAFHAQWDSAEVIFTEKSILYFNYVSILGYRLYMQVRHWYLRGAKIPHRLSQSAPIKKLEIKGQDLVISSSLRNAEVTTTLKGVVSSEQFAVIQKMLNLSTYQEG